MSGDVLVDAGGDLSRDCQSRNYMVYSVNCLTPAIAKKLRGRAELWGVRDCCVVGVKRLVFETANTWSEPQRPTGNAVLGAGFEMSVLQPNMPSSPIC
jgi:hypothetical protein